MTLQEASESSRWEALSETKLISNQPTVSWCADLGESWLPPFDSQLLES